MKKLILPLMICIILLAIPLAYADYQINIENIKNTINEGESASYKLTFTTEKGTNLTLDIDSDKWTYSFSDNIGSVNLAKGENKTIDLTLTPKKKTDFGTYNLGLITAEGKEANTNILKLTYLESSPESAITISHESNIPNKIKPGNNLILSLVLINEKNAELNDINVKVLIKDVLEHDQKVSFTNYERKVLNLELPVPLTAEPNNKDLQIIVSINNNILSQKKYNLETLTVNPNLDVEESTEGSFLKRTVTHKTQNKGNLPLIEKYSVRINPLLKIFTSSDGDYDNGAYIWNLELGAGENKDLIIRYNYRWLAVIIVIIIILIMLFQYLKPDVFMNKQLLNVIFDDNGNFFEGRVVITLKNKTKSSIKGVLVSETLPEFIELSHKEAHGSMKPKVQHLDHTTKLVWQISEMVSDEERIISYYIKSRYSIIGRVNLPAAIIGIQIGDKIQKLYSNSISVESNVQPKREKEIEEVVEEANQDGERRKDTQI